MPIEEKSNSSPQRNYETLLPLKNSSRRQLKNHVHVSVRLKPVNVVGTGRDNAPGHHSERNKVWRAINEHQIRQTITDEVFTFDRVYDEKMDTACIFKDHFKDMIEQSLNGYNVTIFAYGQTSSGKTHTMSGDLQSEMELQHGIIPLSAFEIFKKVHL